MSLTTAVRSLNRSASKKFPGASEADLAVYLKYVFEAAATNLKSTYKDEDATAAADKELAEAAERGESWAVGLRDSKLLNIVKPVVDKAVAKGVDPVTALLLEDFSEDEARAYVAELDSRAAAPASVDSDVVAGGDEDEEDEEDGDTASTDAVSYGYGTPVASA